MAVIVRGFWGNACLARRSQRPPTAFAGMLQTITDLKERGDQTDVIYCFGEDNRDYLKYIGFEDVRMLDRKSWALPKPLEQFHHRWDGAWVHGCSYWWHKFCILTHATKDFDDVLWLDADARQLKPITPEIWEDFRSGQDFKAALYLQRNWTWGAGWRRTVKWGAEWFKPLQGEEATRAAQTIPGCGAIYLKSHKTACDLLGIQNQFPFWLDHQVLAYFLDLRHGKWIGDEEYIKQGYHTNYYYYGRLLYPPSPEETVWQVGERFAKVPG